MSLGHAANPMRDGVPVKDNGEIAIQHFEQGKEIDTDVNHPAGIAPGDDRAMPKGYYYSSLFLGTYVVSN